MEERLIKVGITHGDINGPIPSWRSFARRVSMSRPR